MTTGKSFIFDCGNSARPRYLVNFPTKQHWRGKSKMEFVTTGLDDLVTQLRDFDIHSIAVPALGCGLGGLDWSDVKTVIAEKLGGIENVEFQVFEPV